MVTQHDTAIKTHTIHICVFIFLRVKAERFTFGPYLLNLVEGNGGAANTLWDFALSVDK